MKKKSLVPIVQIIEELFKKKNSPFSEGYFLLQLIRSWPEIAGESIAQLAHPVKVTKKELTLALPSSSHVQEIQFVKEALRKKINQRFPARKVNRIILRVEKVNPINSKWVNKILS